MSEFGSTSIVIPTYNGLHLLKPCIASIRQHTESPYEIIVVDNGSGDDTIGYCLREGLTLVALPVNSGFPIACNKGLAIASGDQIVLLNNDVLVTPRWLTNMMSALYSSEDIGLVGPVTNYASGQQQVDMVDDWDNEHFNRPDPAGWHSVQRLVGLCLVMKREIFRKVGFLDERFSPGHYEDDDYCYRVRRAGYRLLMCRDTFIYHKGSASFKAENPEGWDVLIKRNRQLFIDKWGIDPWHLV